MHPASTRAAHIGLGLILCRHVHKELLHVPVENGAQVGVNAEVEDGLIMPRAIDLAPARQLAHVLGWWPAQCMVGTAAHSKSFSRERLTFGWATCQYVVPAAMNERKPNTLRQ